jgi:hypothetical protein
MKTALLLIATGDRYERYIQPLLDSAKKYFVEHMPFLWTDRERRFTEMQFRLEDQGFPYTTLHRYHTFCSYAMALSQYEQLFYCDIDMKFVAPIQEEEIFSSGITATEHPGYVGSRGTPEMNPYSAAYLPKIRTYFCGGFNGGESAAFLRMTYTIRKAIDVDEPNGIRAIWNDESYLNRYLYDHPPARVLSPSFCYPQSEYEVGKGNGFYGQIWKRAGRTDMVPKLIALDKEP